MSLCAGCNKTIGNDQDDVTTEIGIQYHRDCYDKMYYDKYQKYPHKTKSDKSPAASLKAKKESEMKSPCRQSNEEETWKCTKCTNDNSISDERCYSCSKLRYPDVSSKQQEKLPQKTENDSSPAASPKVKKGSKKKTKYYPSSEEETWECSGCRKDNPISDKQCKSCHKQRYPDAVPKHQPEENSDRRNSQDKNPNPLKKTENDSSPAASPDVKKGSKKKTTYYSSSDEETWKCSRCSKDNPVSDKQCKSCHKQRYPDAVPKHQPEENSDRRNSQDKNPKLLKKTENDSSPAASPDVKKGSKKKTKYYPSSEEETWECSGCRKDNPMSDKQCKSCDKQRYPDALPKHEPEENSDRHDSQEKNPNPLKKTESDSSPAASPKVKKGSKKKTKYYPSSEEETWECSGCRKDNPMSDKQCKSCDKQRYPDALPKHEPEENSDRHDSQDKNPKLLKKTENDSSPAASSKVKKGPKTKTTYYSSSDEETWKCSRCSKDNPVSDKQCKSCHKQRYPDAVPKHQPEENSDRHDSQDKNPKLLKKTENDSVPAASPKVKKGSEMETPYYPSSDEESDNQSVSNRSDPEPDIHLSPNKTQKKVSNDDDSSDHSESRQGEESSDEEEDKYEENGRKSPLHSSTVTSKTPHTESTSDQKYKIYIPDLPSAIQDDFQLEQMVRRRLENVLNIQISNIKCYSKQGIGVIQVKDSQLRNRLLEVAKLVLDPKDGKNMITFTDALEVVSYVVLDVAKVDKDTVLPTTKEVTRRWCDLHEGDSPQSCDTLNGHFPNIYRIASTSLDKLLNIQETNVFKIGAFIAHVYYCANCSFFEDLPTSIVQGQIRKAISTAIGKSDLSSSSLYIQINKQAAVACIIAADIARQWCTKTYITIDKHVLSRIIELACRLSLRPIPKTLDIRTIINHAEFKGTVTNYKHNGDQLVVEISDKNIFEKFCQRGVLRIDENILYVDVYAQASSVDPEEIFKTMLQYEADIMQFIAKPEHPIFQYEWDPQTWLQHFKQVASQKRDDSRKITHDPKNLTPDQQRHTLRVIVMLNTLATIKKRTYTIDHRQINLNLKENLKTILYDHQSVLQQSSQIALTNPPNKATTVRVVQDDCLVVYENMIKEGRRPVLLNMASASSPGGGYRRGDGAQEENLFRRSDYCRSLDVELDEFFQQEQERLYCSSKCRLETISTQTNNMYPMQEYGAIYTSGITVFRQPEATGYEFMERPVEDVCAIAMAAYHEPEIKDNMLASKHAVGTRKKIENIFAIAYQHKHDCLVLSAFGCGAFKNPPHHVVSLFQSVIEQYAGFFKHVVFAVIDDHNAGRQLNPQGNFRPFFDALDGMVAQSRTITSKPHVMYGPYRFSQDGSTINDVRIFDQIPCQYGAKCTQMNDAEHANQYSHPPICLEIIDHSKCKYSNDVVHMMSFIHRIACRHGGECKQIDNEKHRSEYSHPDYCSDGGKCQNLDNDHLKQYRHLPLCSEARKCVQFQKSNHEHCKNFRHCTPFCPHGNNCAMSYDRKHLEKYQHPFPTPCSRTPFDCQYYIELTGSKNTRKLAHETEQHCLDFAHVCRFGRLCNDKSSLHLSKSIHIARHMCQYDRKCNKLNDEDHLNSFTHSDIPDIRVACQNGRGCPDRQTIDHIRRLRHPIFEENGVVMYNGSNEKINFVQNQKDNIDKLNGYMKKNNWTSLPLNKIPREILNWIQNVQPIHRCTPAIFESIVLHGHAMSREYMQHLTNRRFVVKSIMHHSQLRNIEALKQDDLKSDVKKYVAALVNLEFQKNGLTTDYDTNPAGISYSKEEQTRFIKTKENKLSDNMSDEDLKTLRTKAIEVAEASIKLHQNPLGIGHPPDKLLGNDKLIFSILGPNNGHYYGDVIIVFKREILHHPDANFSMQAATSFASGNAYKWREWLGDKPASQDEQISHYHRTKLHAAVPGYDYAVALELMVIAGGRLKSKSMSMTLTQILDEWVKLDAHTNIEAHLPQLIPLDYIDHVYIPKNLYDGLEEKTRTAIKKLNMRITLAPFDGDADHDRSTFGPTPKSKSRADYQDFVMKKIREGYEQNATHSLPSNIIDGFTINLPSSAFNDHILLPLTITQAYAQHRLQHFNPSKENIVYIYWKAFHGDMMLTLSNQQIVTDEKQLNLRSLICYLAPTSSNNDNHYHERISYISPGHPFHHSKIIKRKEYKAKSNSFYTGCDPRDFFTYCLEIHRSTGEIVLSHAGSNAIYNHEQISYAFSKSEFDLSALDYVHVSAGSDNMCIRNLKICFEKEKTLHPSFDQEFTSPIKNKRESDSSRDSSPQPNSSKSYYGEGIINKLSKLKDRLQRDSSPSRKRCPKGIYCLIQHSEDGKEHNAQYFHPCRYSERCDENEPHLTHEPHEVSECHQGKTCSKLDDPYHRASYRHRGYPDFLIPCHKQNKCENTTRKHRIVYFHGEQVLQKTKPTESSSYINDRSDSGDDDLQPCQYGQKCYDLSNSHRMKYSHPPSGLYDLTNNTKTPCQWGEKCHDDSAHHRAKYSHPPHKPKHVPDITIKPCQWGEKCYDLSDSHRKKFSHPSTKIQCKWGADCHDFDSKHRAKFSHPTN